MLAAQKLTIQVSHCLTPLGDETVRQTDEGAAPHHTHISLRNYP
jgi:hypothetical protein